jgi:hypothetical protein
VRALFTQGVITDLWSASYHANRGQPAASSHLRS